MRNMIVLVWLLAIIVILVFLRGATAKKNATEELESLGIQHDRSSNFDIILGVVAWFLLVGVLTYLIVTE